MKVNNSSDILLESGTNELEILEFTIAGNSFGINVAKVRELMQHKPVQPMPRAHRCIEGIFKPRDTVLTVINLAEYMGLPESEDNERDIFIVTGFNNMNMAFHVHTVESIHRVSWQAIEKPDSTIYGGDDGTITGIAKIKDKMISIVDFEKIVTDFAPDEVLQTSSLRTLGDRERVQTPILIAEDSMILKKMIIDALSASGYSNIIATNNGQEAWDKLLKFKEEGDIASKVKLVITDIEMPLMDGHRLVKLIKETPEFNFLPVIIFSSLIDDAMKLKGLEVGADAQLTKPEILKLVKIIDELLAQQQA